MRQPFSKRILVPLAFGLLLISVVSCNGTGAGIRIEKEPVVKGGPPPHAPAHGYRAKHRYHYYPDAYVYFDISRKVYFYLETDQWRMTASLPRNLNAQLGGYVLIEMDSDKPYSAFQYHRHKYPPGQQRKTKEKERKGNWAHKEKSSI